MSFSVNRQRSLWWGLSLVVILSGLVAMAISWVSLGSPLRLGLDFIGGTRLQFELACSATQTCSQPIDIDAVRQVLNQQGLGNSSLQIIDQYGVSIRTVPLDVDQRTRLSAALTQKIGDFDPQKTQIETVVLYPWRRNPAIGVAGALGVVYWHYDLSHAAFSV